VVILVDFIHVLEYLWKAAWCFFDEGDPEVEQWVHGHAFTILQGRSSDVAGAIRRGARRGRGDPRATRPAEQRRL
jgi:hypothetical protein